MSFTGIVKNELSKLELDKLEAITLLSAIIKNTALIDEKSIKITTENSSVARQIFNLIKEVYNIAPKITLRRGYNYNKHYIYILEIKEKLDLIKEDLSLNTNIPNGFIIDDDNLTRIYLRGVFIACGSVNDPKKSRYHLEFIVETEEYANFINDSLNSYFLNSKVLKRDNKYMIYIKEAEKIGDFLRMMNAISALLYFEDIRIYRDHKNMTNRLNNCEQANIEKSLNSSNEQLKMIDILMARDDYELLDEKIRIICEYKKKYPESSMLELSEIISYETGKNITKSGINHRMRKIKELTKKEMELEEN